MSDLIIRGMEMPKERSLWLCVKTDGTVHNIKPGGIGTAHAVGTAVPLPEKHGRLIDGDALAEQCDSPHWCVWLNEIQDAPTIVPAEGGTDE